MPTIHCHICGGFIADPAGTTYRSPDPAAPTAAIPHTALCTCDHAVIYELLSDPVAPAVPADPITPLRGVHHIRSASRN